MNSVQPQRWVKRKIPQQTPLTSGKGMISKILALSSASVPGWFERTRGSDTRLRYRRLDGSLISTG
jgi:hypothetical protein